VSTPQTASAPVDLTLGLVARVRRAFSWAGATARIVGFYKSDNLTFAASIASRLLSFFRSLLSFSIVSRIAVAEGGGALLPSSAGCRERFDFVSNQMKELVVARAVRRRQHAHHHLGVDGRVRRGDVRRQPRVGCR
jgi:hypothetical protein